eukprot:scpid12736/ scgid21001/ 
MNVMTCPPVHGSIACAVKRLPRGTIWKASCHEPSADFVQPVECVNPYSVGSTVMLRQGDRRQKRTAPYEAGWTVDTVVSPSTVAIVRDTNGRHSVKTVNIDLIKPSSMSVPEFDDTSDSDSDVPAQPLQVGGHRLRNRAGLVPPVRYRS